MQTSESIFKAEKDGHSIFSESHFPIHNTAANSPGVRDVRTCALGMRGATCPAPGAASCGGVPHVIDSARDMY